MLSASQQTIEKAPVPTPKPTTTPTPPPTPQPTATPVAALKVEAPQPVAECPKCVPGFKQANKGVVENEIKKVFGKGVAVAVFKQESGLQSNIYNGSCCYGVTQIHLIAHYNQIPGETTAQKISWLMDYQNNISFGHQLYVEQGWRPWEAFTSGAYKKYL